MIKELKKTYYLLIFPAVILTIIAYLLFYFKVWGGVAFSPSRNFSIIFFIVAITIGVALPIFLRVYFFSKLKTKHFTTQKEFIRYQKLIIKIAAITAYLAFIAAFLRMETFYFGGTVLAAIYAIYYHYPSEKKIKFDQKIFKVQKEGNGEG